MSEVLPWAEQVSKQPETPADKIKAAYQEIVDSISSEWFNETTLQASPSFIGGYNNFSVRIILNAEATKDYDLNDELMRSIIAKALSKKLENLGLKNKLSHIGDDRSDNLSNDSWHFNFDLKHAIKKDVFLDKAYDRNLELVRKITDDTASGTLEEKYKNFTAYEHAANESYERLSEEEFAEYDAHQTIGHTYRRLAEAITEKQCVDYMFQSPLGQELEAKLQQLQQLPVKKTGMSIIHLG